MVCGTRLFWFSTYQYVVVLVIMNYPFLMVYEQSWLTGVSVCAKLINV